MTYLSATLRKFCFYNLCFEIPRCTELELSMEISEILKSSSKAFCNFTWILISRIIIIKNLEYFLTSMCGDKFFGKDVDKPMISPSKNNNASTVVQSRLVSCWVFYKISLTETVSCIQPRPVDRGGSCTIRTVTLWGMDPPCWPGLTPGPCVTRWGLN